MVACFKLNCHLKKSNGLGEFVGINKLIQFCAAYFLYHRLDCQRQLANFVVAKSGLPVQADSDDFFFRIVKNDGKGMFESSRGGSRDSSGNPLPLSESNTHIVFVLTIVDQITHAMSSNGEASSDKL